MTGAAGRNTKLAPEQRSEIARKAGLAGGAGAEEGGMSEEETKTAR
jgi:hypothetical protein